MRQFLSKTLDVLQRLYRALVAFIVWVVALLRSVNIDQPRVVILCVALQLITIAVSFVAFRRDTDSLAKPVPGQMAPPSPDAGSDAGTPN